MNDIAAQEHIDHIAGSASELQNCFAEANSYLSARNAKVQREIDRCINDGLHVVVAREPYNCKATDALVGEALYIVGAYGDRDAAQRTIDGYYANDYDHETTYDLYPEPEPVAQPAPVVEDDGVPF